MLNRSYPISYLRGDHAIISIGLTIWIFVFLWFPEPFSFDELNSVEKWNRIPYYALSGGAVYFVVSMVYLKWVDKSQLWMVRNEISLLSFSSLIAFAVAFVIHTQLYAVGFSFKSAHWFLMNVFMPSILIVGPFIGVARVLIGLRRQLLNYKERSIQESNTENSEELAEKETTQVSDKLRIKGEGRNEIFQISQNAVIYMKSDNNYVECHYVQEGKKRIQNIRIKLYEIEKENAFLIRSHRSYLFNPSHFVRFTKEKGKLFMEMTYETKVPVSKSNRVIVEQAIEEFLD